MSKVRINDLARELEVKSKSILDALTAVGVAEKKTHSSSIEEDEAEKVRGYLTGGGRPSGGSRYVSSHQPARIDLSKAAKPGDALKAILERKQADAALRSAPPPQRPAVVVAPPSSAAGNSAPQIARPVVTVPPASAQWLPRRPRSFFRWFLLLSHLHRHLLPHRAALFLFHDKVQILLYRHPLQLSRAGLR